MPEEEGEDVRWLEVQESGSTWEVTICGKDFSLQ
jgi:hypothetical protein